MCEDLFVISLSNLFSKTKLSGKVSLSIFNTSSYCFLDLYCKIVFILKVTCSVLFLIVLLDSSVCYPLFTTVLQTAVYMSWSPCLTTRGGLATDLKGDPEGGFTPVDGRLAHLCARFVLQLAIELYVPHTIVTNTTGLPLVSFNQASQLFRNLRLFLLKH